jgi:SAM-dependent methyltransferase
METKWYESFFQGIVLDMWSQAVPEEHTRAEAAFLESKLGATRGARVLDVPCGSGRHALEMASRGYAVTGVDLSEEQIERARSASRKAGLEIDWRRADMRDLPRGEAFDAAWCLGNSFGYVEPQGNRDFLRAIAGALKPGARFVMDTGAAAESVLPGFREREWMQVGEILFLEENRYHAAESCKETIYTFARGGESRTRSGLQWVFTTREILAMFDEAGLEVLETFSSIDGAPFEAGCPVLILVARRR